MRSLAHHGEAAFSCNCGSCVSVSFSMGGNAPSRSTVSGRAQHGLVHRISLARCSLHRIRQIVFATITTCCGGVSSRSSANPYDPA